MIKIYDKALNPLCVLTKVISLQWTKRFYDVGSFKLHLSITDENLKYIKEGHYISHEGKNGIINYIEISKNEVIIWGYDLKGILKKRKCIGEKTGKAETVIKSYVRENLITAETKRRVNSFLAASDLGRGETISWKSELSKLDIEVNKICTMVELGYDVTLIESSFVFDVFKGIDRTVNQTDRPPVVFSKQFKNISDYNYTYDGSTSYNTLYINQTEIYNEVYTGLERNEGIDTSTGTAEEIQTRGKLLLKENAPKESVSAEANHRQKYKTDWDLGDYVTLKIEVLGELLLMDKQITEVLEVYERGNATIEPTFGEVKDSIIKKLMR